MTGWAFVSGHCSGCRSFPCQCRPPVTARCVCGSTLEATDTLEDKRRAHVEHVPTVMHQAWRWHQRRKA